MNDEAGLSAEKKSREAADIRPLLDVRSGAPAPIDRLYAFRAICLVFIATLVISFIALAAGGVEPVTALFVAFLLALIGSAVLGAIAALLLRAQKIETILASAAVTALLGVLPTALVPDFYIEVGGIRVGWSEVAALPSIAAGVVAFCVLLALARRFARFEGETLADWKRGWKEREPSP